MTEEENRYITQMPNKLENELEKEIKDESKIKEMLMGTIHLSTTVNTLAS